MLLRAHAATMTEGIIRPHVFRLCYVSDVYPLGPGTQLRQIRSLLMIYMIDASQGRQIPGAYDLHALFITLADDNRMI